jgi:hypothetical protein
MNRKLAFVVVLAAMLLVLVGVASAQTPTTTTWPSCRPPTTLYCSAMYSSMAYFAIIPDSGARP